jgi:hypothetical protein
VVPACMASMACYHGFYAYVCCFQYAVTGRPVLCPVRISMSSSRLDMPMSSVNMWLDMQPVLTGHAGDRKVWLTRIDYYYYAGDHSDCKAKATLLGSVHHRQIAVAHNLPPRPQYLNAEQVWMSVCPHPTTTIKPPGQSCVAW